MCERGSPCASAAGRAAKPTTSFDVPKEDDENGDEGEGKGGEPLCFALMAELTNRSTLLPVAALMDDTAIAKVASVELIYLGEIVASKGSNMRIWSCVLNNALMMASLVIGVLSLWQGLEEVQSDKISRMECIYCMLYSFLAGLHKMPHRAVSQSHPRLCTGYTGGTLGCARCLVAMGHRQAPAALALNSLAVSS